MPSRTARATASSPHAPMPVAASGVMLGATTCNSPSLTKSAPLPSGATRAGGVFVASVFVWHS
jgi:hypothetical protein